MELDIASVADRPDRRALYEELDDLWPEFMTKDPTSGLYYGYQLDAYPQHVLSPAPWRPGANGPACRSTPPARSGCRRR